MPRKKANTRPTADDAVQQGRYYSPPDAVWGGFLNLRLTDEEKEGFYRFCEDKPNWFWPELDDLLSEGLKLSVSYDRTNQAYVAAVTGRLALCCPERCSATARAGTFEEAIALIVYKHVVLADGDWSNYRPKTSTLMAWG